MIDKERCKTDFVCWVENCCTINGKPIKLTEKQREVLKELKKESGEHLTFGLLKATRALVCDPARAMAEQEFRAKLAYEKEKENI